MKKAYEWLKEKARVVAVLVAAGAASLVSGSALAVIDVSDITDKVTEVGVAVAIIGAAVLVMIVGVKVWKWLRRAL